MSDSARDARRIAALHSIDVRLENRPGALHRLLGIVRRHDGNVEHLLVAPTDRADVSRAMLVVRATDACPMVRQMTRLLSVFSVTMQPAPATALDRRAAGTETTHTEER